MYRKKTGLFCCTYIAITLYILSKIRTRKGPALFLYVFTIMCIIILFSKTAGLLPVSL